MSNKLAELLDHAKKARASIFLACPEDVAKDISGVLGEFASVIADLLNAKDVAYSERNKLVALLAATYDSHLCKHDPNDEAWDKEWMNIVCIHLPTGQATWHIHDSEMPLFSFLKERPNHWDSHSTEEKYERVALLTQQLYQIRNAHNIHQLSLNLEG